MLVVYFGIERVNVECWLIFVGVCVRIVINVVEFIIGLYYFCKYCSLMEFMEYVYMFIFIFMCGYVYIYM